MNRKKDKCEVNFFLPTLKEKFDSSSDQTKKTLTCNQK